ncbi:MAG: glycosyltransferase [Selenomonadaceae bacterium]|nr:glycosyltransferase [Selenomonadaceae bacterium]
MKNPAVSVIIPMYNVERYVGECLDSVLLQTFQDFEVIVVDDCSTDDSVKIVEEYVPKFDGRLQLVHMEKNTGTPGKPRNRGIELARGEYIFFADADDFMLLNTLETLYKPAKEYEADVVYTSTHYLMKKPNEVIVLVDDEGKKLRSEGLEDKPALIVDDLKKNLDKLFIEGNFHGPCTKFVRREFLIKENLFFPDVPSGEDFLWVIKLYCRAKRFLRFPVPLHFYRNYNENSITQKKRSPQEQYSHWITVFVTWAKHFSKLVMEIDLLKDNSAYCYRALKSEFDWCRYRSREGLTPLNNQEIYELLQQKFAHEEDLSLLAMPFFLTLTEVTRKARSTHLQMIYDLRKEIKQLKSAVSIIVTMHNAEKYIGGCLDSLLAQTFNAFEVIVVDDCSTDDSFKIVEDYAPKFKGQLTLINTESHLGNVCAVRNVGLSLASGRYVFFMDAQDFVDRTAIETLYKAARESNADVVYTSRYRLVNSSNKRLLQRDGTCKRLRLDGQKDKKLLTVDAPDNLLQEVLSKDQYCEPCTKFIRRSLLTKNEITFPEVIAGEELWTLLICANANRFLRLPSAIYFMRQRSAMKASSSDFIAWFEAFRDIANKIEFLKENPAHCRKFAKTYFDSLALNSADSREVYKALLGEEVDDLTESFCRLIEPPPDVKADDVTSEPAPTAYGVSVVIPLYNCEQYIGECLDSLLAQTFNAFEVIVVDDCSTDDSAAIVKRYIPKFGGRLKLTRTNINSGGSGVPRNKGLFFCKGEYVLFMDANDMLTRTALETMYNAAKQFDADTVYCENFLTLGATAPEVDDKAHESDLETDDLTARFDNALKQNYALMPWLRLVSRNLLIENNINFSSESNNVGWAFAVLLYSKKFLRISNACYVKRTHTATPSDVRRYMSRTICGLKEMDDFMGEIDFFKANPRYRYDLLNLFMKTELGRVVRQNDNLSAFELYELLRGQFGEYLGEHAVLVSCLCSGIISQQKEINQLKAKE